MAVGKIRGVYGLKGHLKVEPLTDFPSRYKDLTRVRLVKGGQVREATIENGKERTAGWLIKLKEINCREGAGAVVGYYIMIPREERRPLPPGHYYLDQLIGLKVYTEEGEELGTLGDVIQTGSNDVYVVKAGEGGRLSRDILIPALGGVVKEVNLPEQKMLVRLPQGLLE